MKKFCLPFYESHLPKWERAWNKIIKKAWLFLMSLELHAPSPPPPPKANTAVKVTSRSSLLVFLFCGTSLHFAYTLLAWEGRRGDNSKRAKKVVCILFHEVKNYYYLCPFRLI